MKKLLSIGSIRLYSVRLSVFSESIICRPGIIKSSPICSWLTEPLTAIHLGLKTISGSPFLPSSIQVVEDYREKGTPEPGLVTKERTPEEQAQKNKPDNGRVEIEVYAYYTDRLVFRILNGTDESMSISDTVKLVQNSNDEVLYDMSSEYPIDVSAASAEEESICLPGRLKEGMYTLYVGDYSAEFEIRLRDGQPSK